jgi:hypothetical protein
MGVWKRIVGWLTPWRTIKDQTAMIAEMNDRIAGLSGKIKAAESLAGFWKAEALERTRAAEHDLNAMREAHKNLLAEDVGRDLVRIIMAHGLVGCQLDALRERLGIGALKDNETPNIENQTEPPIVFPATGPFTPLDAKPPLVITRYPHPPPG